LTFEQQEKDPGGKDEQIPSSIRIVEIVVKLERLDSKKSTYAASYFGEDLN
jgi:hypothetical protein